MASLDYYNQEFFESIMLKMQQNPPESMQVLGFAAQACAILRHSDYTPLLI